MWSEPGSVDKVGNRDVLLLVLTKNKTSTPGLGMHSSCPYLDRASNRSEISNFRLGQGLQMSATSVAMNVCVRGYLEIYLFGVSVCP